MTDLCRLPEPMKKAIHDIVVCRNMQNRVYADQHPNDAKRQEHCDFDTMDALMHEAGADYIGNGVYRRTYRWDDCVVKVAKYPASETMNRNEYMAYKTAPRSVRRLLAPVGEIGDNGEYITMKYADTRVEHPLQTARELQTELQSIGHKCSDIRDDNIGIIGGRPVIIDYNGYVLDCVVNNQSGRQQK